jgi:hypothetical protein
MLSRHKKLAHLLKKTDYSSGDNRPSSAIHFLLALIGLPIAAIGVLLAFLPYQLCDYMVKHRKKYDMASAATFKVVYSLFLFPVAFIIEAMILHIFFGWVVSLLFVVLIIPICYFTLYFMEWLYEGGWGIPVSFRKSRKTFHNRITHLLKEQNRHIKDLIDKLAAMLDQQT